MTGESVSSKNELFIAKIFVHVSEMRKALIGRLAKKFLFVWL